MPAAWIGAASALYGATQSGNGGGGGGGGSKGPTYTPQGLGQADQGWLNSFNQVGNINNQDYAKTAPLYNQSLQQEQGINYGNYQQNANLAGQEYGNLAGMANSQMGQYNQNAQTAEAQQAALYGGANQIMNQAFDPNMAQYNQSFNNLQGQVNAGQAMRGLGNSAVGAQEANNAASNFGINWNTQQLQNEQIGLQGASAASNAGGAQGQLVGSNMSAALQAGQQGAGYQMQAGSVPIQAQQMIAGMPAQNAAQYQGNMQNLETGYGNQMSQAVPYMNNGQGAQQWNTNYNTQQNAANMNLLTQSAQGIANQYNTPGSWLNNAFNSQDPYQGIMQQNQQAVNSYTSGWQGQANTDYNSIISSVPTYSGDQ